MFRLQLYLKTVLVFEQICQRGLCKAFLTEIQNANGNSPSGQSRQLYHALLATANISRAQRVCTLCQTGNLALGDEQHVVGTVGSYYRTTASLRRCTACARVIPVQILVHSRQFPEAAVYLKIYDTAPAVR